jgi:tRNA-Thr(GGU) m(6)t(6)A37 methyltransferase TsaA
MKIEYQPIGVIHSPYRDIAGMPIQPAGAAGVTGSVELYPEYIDGLQDLGGFSHVVLLYHFHQVTGFSLVVTPFLDDKRHGVFATRAPRRPNPIGLSVVRLVKIEGNLLAIENVDILDGTPLLDIKPYVPQFDQFPVDKIGWLEDVQSQVNRRRSDRRFE